MKPAVHIMVGSKEMHDNMEKALIDAVEHVKNAPIQGKIYEPLKRTRDNKRVHGKDNSIMLLLLKNKALLPLDKYGQPLENLDRFTNK
jgi:hypothetical protein